MNTEMKNTDDFFESLKQDWQKEKIPNKSQNSKKIQEKALLLKKKQNQKSVAKAIIYFGCLAFIWIISFWSIEESKISFLGLGLLSVSLLLPALYQVWYVYKWSEINFVELPQTTLKITLQKLKAFKQTNFYLQLITILFSVITLIFGLQIYFNSFLESHKLHKLISLVIILILIDAIFFRYKKIKKETQKFTDLIQQLENI